MIYFQSSTIFSLLKSNYLNDLQIFDDDFAIYQKLNFFKPLIVYLLLTATLWSQYNHLIIMITAIAIVIIVVVQAIQHNVMQHCQHLVLIHKLKCATTSDFTNNFTFHVFDDLAAVFNEMYPK